MPVYIFKGGSFYPLASQKVFIQHRWQELPKLARIYINSAWHYVGRVLQRPSVYGKSEFEHDAVSVDVITYNYDQPRTISLVSGGSLYSSIVSSGYTYAVSEGCAAIRCSCCEGGRLIVSSGGVAYQCIPDDGAVIVSSGGIAVQTPRPTYHGGGYVLVTSGGTSLDSWNGYVTVMRGGTASRVSAGLTDADHPNNQLNLTLSGGLAKDIVISSSTMDQRLDILSGGSAQNITISSGARFHVFFKSGGGFADYIDIQPGGFMTVWSGGYARNIIVSSGAELRCLNSGVATSVTVLSGGTATAAAYGGRLTNVTSQPGAVVG